MSKTVAFVCAKGGTGKTTSTASIGFALAAQGQRVLLIDLDSQSNLTGAVGGKRTTALYTHLRSYVETGAFRTPDLLQPLTDRISLIAAHPSMINLDDYLSRADCQSRVQTCLRDLPSFYTEQYDYILLDCPPALNRVVMAALVAATDVLIPVVPEPMAVDGLAMMLTTLQKVRDTRNLGLRIAGVIPTMTSSLSVQKVMQERIATICGRYDVPILPGVPRRTVAQQAVGQGKSIIDYPGAGAVARAYERIASRVMLEGAAVG